MRKSERFRGAENETDDDFDYLFKIVMIGDAGVGKSAIVHRFKYNTFVDRHASTIGVDFLIKSLIVDGKKIKLQIWDTAGQERFRTITQSYYRSAHGVIIVYDITKFNTFKNSSRWLKDVQKFSGNSVMKMLIGNKCDLTSDREVEKSQAEEFAKFHSIFEIIETSAKDSTNVEEAFYQMASSLKQNFEEDELINENNINENNLMIESRSVQKLGCCS